MIHTPEDVLEKFPVRKSKLQKAQFRDAVMAYIRSLGYECKAEKGSLGATNVVFGNQEGAKYLVTAHYDTCAAMPVPNLITPCNSGLYLLYQLAIVLGFFAVSGLSYYVVHRVTQNREIAFYTSYFCLLAMCYLMMFGPANKTNANDNTSGVVTVLEIAKALPAEYRDQVCFVLFDLEEAGLIGSSSYRSKHKKATQNQIVMNLDCVGDGDHLVLFPGGKVKKNIRMMENLAALEGVFGSKDLKLHKKGFAMYPSDQANFPYGVGVAAFHMSSWGGLYLARIHTKKDTICEMENVAILRDALVKIIENQ